MKPWDKVQCEYCNKEYFKHVLWKQDFNFCNAECLYNGTKKREEINEYLKTLTKIKPNKPWNIFD